MQAYKNILEDQWLDMKQELDQEWAEVLKVKSENDQKWTDWSKLKSNTH